jgi:two-component system, chemotaxis family, chemotaxis protein CheY
MRVLVAEDSSTMRSILRRALKTLNVAETVEVADGESAIETFKKGSFDLVLTDWNMPGKSGLDVVREIRAIDKDVPIIMVTTESEQCHVVDAIQSGVTDYLIKPFTVTTLEDKLWRFVGQEA